jgi:Acyl-coenzyme A:6-aminopenicillanic acid acyl-transferase
MAHTTTRILEVAGTARERGEMQGAAAKTTLVPAIDALATLPLFPGWMPRAARSGLVQAATSTAGRFYLGRHRRLLGERFDGRNLDLVHGLADGADTSAVSVYGVNAFELESANVGFSLGCTALGLAGHHAADGEPRLVYNHDFPPAFEPFLRIRRSRPDSGLSSLALTYPTLIGAVAGLNEAGLAMSYNQAYATDLERFKPALFVTMLLQECLERCRSVEQAIELVLATPVTNGAMLTLVDASGDRAAIELSASRKEVRREQPASILYTFNKYRCDAMTPLEVPVGAVTTGIAAGYDVHRCNLTRQARLLAMDLAEPLDDTGLFALMADHDGGMGDENSICRHDDPMSETIFTAVMNPSSRSMRVLFGKPCQQQAQTVYLHDDLRGRAIEPMPMACGASSSSSVV